MPDTPPAAPVDPAAPTSPATPIQDPPAAAAAPPATPTPPTPPSTEPPKTTDLDGLSSEQLAKMVRDLRKENAADRTNAKQTAAQEAKDALAQSIGKALGLVKDDEPVDPDELRGEITAAQQEARAIKVENAVLRSAGQHGADPTRLTDSRSFMSTLDALDPTAADFGTQVDDAIKAAVAANPTFKAGRVTQQHDVAGLKPGASPNDPLDDADAMYQQYYPNQS